MSRDQGTRARGMDQGGAGKRRFEEDRQGGRFQPRFEEDRQGSRFQAERSRGPWGEEEGWGNQQYREKIPREWNVNQMRGPNPYRGDEGDNRRRLGDTRRDEPNNGAGRDRFQGNQPIPIHERLGRKEIQRGPGEEANQGKNASADTRMGSGSKEVGICFWCRQDGHHQADCTNPPFCFRCKESGHIAAKCPSSQGATMHMFGFGFPGLGFHALKIPGVAKQPKVEHTGLIRVEEGIANEQRIEEELKHMIDKNWQWKVRKILEKEYLAIFPNKQILDTFSNTNGVSMSLYNIWAKISISHRDPTASSVLETGWVHLFNVLDQARSVEAVTLIAELAGEVIAVDEVSLIKEDPVRVKLQAREIAKIRGFVEIFVAGVGYEVKFAPENTGKTNQSVPPHPPPGKFSRYNEDDEDDLLSEEEDNSGKGDPKGGQKSVTTQQQGSGSKTRQNRTDCYSQKPLAEDIVTQVLDPKPISAFDPCTNTITKLTASTEVALQEVTQTNTTQKEVVIPPDKFLVHCEGDGYIFMDKCKWPQLNLREEQMTGKSSPEEARKEMELETNTNGTESTWEMADSQKSMGAGEIEECGSKMGELLGVASGESENEECASQEDKETWEVVLATKKKSTKRNFYPAVAARKSSRVSKLNSPSGKGGFELSDSTEMESLTQA
ncbi:unnamed protein product [Urochloa decumbens]|uniref:CCHC-type domain-containing protein n=1 Tax=Urochloa decumbens TaxID=240449 RepID=A0ABC9C505_9POAL